MNAQLELTQLHDEPPEVPTDPGVYYNLPFDIYQRIDAINIHGLLDLAKSPAYYRYRRDNPKKPSDAMLQGSALHCRVLEPERFGAAYCKGIKCDKRTTEGKAAWSKFLNSSEGKEVLDLDAWGAVTAMAKAVLEHPIAGPLLSFEKLVEVVIVWRDEPTGLLCKMRADALSTQIKTGIDLKSTRDASRAEFERAIFNFRYNAQGAYYLDGAEAAGIKLDHYAIIAVESDAPYSVAVYRLLDDVIELGRREYRALLGLYAACKSANVWPGYPEQIQDIGIPGWAKKRINEDYAL